MMPVSKKPRKPRQRTQQQDGEVLRDGWDELNEMRASCQRYAQSARVAQIAIRLLKDTPKEEVDKEAFMACSTINKVLPELIEQLHAISKQHEGRSGNTSIDDYPLLMSIGGEYTDWVSRWDNTVMPHISALTGFIAEQEEK